MRSPIVSVAHQSVQLCHPFTSQVSSWRVSKKESESSGPHHDVRAMYMSPFIRARMATMNINQSCHTHARPELTPLETRCIGLLVDRPDCFLHRPHWNPPDVSERQFTSTITSFQRCLKYLNLRLRYSRKLDRDCYYHSR